jgi:hypothetical protein
VWFSMRGASVVVLESVCAGLTMERGEEPPSCHEEGSGGRVPKDITPCHIPLFYEDCVSSLFLKNVCSALFHAPMRRSFRKATMPYSAKSFCSCLFEISVFARLPDLGRCSRSARAVTTLRILIGPTYTAPTRVTFHLLPKNGIWDFAIYNNFIVTTCWGILFFFTCFFFFYVLFLTASTFKM